ncbi:unnamed protein product [Adineta steineri]|uniref:F-box domain-containing protein n=1 Tax=Adineta steineri TaxID=433720 RepID=A0A815HN34_9BILA|nr:unnamed protein product [Adineta steineri]
MSSSMLDTLPVEILYRIFDNLDIQTIILSLRYVCKRFYFTTDSYNRYNFNFKSMSKPYFRFICRLIPYENVISLTLSDEDKTRGQISLFLSLCQIEQFTRLQSLTLLLIEDIHLNIFLNYIITSSLKSLSISTQILHAYQNSTTHLSSVITHHSLQNLYLNINDKDWNGIAWSTNRTLRYLRLVNTITLKQFCIILQHYVCLQTLVLKEVSTDENENDIYPSAFQQLTSLTFEDGRIEIKKIAQCVSFTPSLTYLKIIGDGNLFNTSFDGFEWEKLIRTKLHSIKKFEFFFIILTYSNYRARNIELLMESFRTSFWLNELHCFITCDYITNSRKIMLYTLPICKTYFLYHIDSKKLSITNFTTRINQNDMNNVQQLELQLTKDVNILPIEKIESSNHFLFRNVINLTLVNNDEWPRNSLNFLSNILNLSNIIKLSLSISFHPDHTLNTVSNINKLLKQTVNLRSLLLYDYWAPDNFMTRMETICSMILPNIKHLQIRVKNIDDIKYILERLQHLTSVTFEYAQILTVDRQEFIESLAYLNRYPSSWNSQHALHIWLRNKKKIII